MKTIWKFNVGGSFFPNTCIVGLSRGYKILKFGKQNKEYYIWALVNPEAKTEWHNFSIVGTGQNIEEGFLKDHKYIDSWIENDGPYVWHLFEQI